MNSGFVKTDTLEDALKHANAFEAYRDGNYAQAVKLMRPFAENGDSWAQLYLETTYHGGQGTPQDYQEAVKWYRRSAEQGNSLGQFNLADMYKQGQDYVRAHMWYNLAAAQGNYYARNQLYELAKQMTPSQIAEAQRLARECETANYKNCY